MAALDDSVFYDERYPLFKTRAGRRRFEELQALLSHQASDDSLLGNDLAEILSQSMAGQSAPDQVASSIAARVPEDQWGAFSRMGLDELAKALRASGARYPALASPRARGLALEIQAALRNESRLAPRLAWRWAGWCARPGPASAERPCGPRPGAPFWGGPRSAACASTPTPKSRSSTLPSASGAGRSTSSPSREASRSRPKPASGRVPLGDGDTIEIGQSRFVFKCVTSGNVAQSRSGA